MPLRLAPPPKAAALYRPSRYKALHGGRGSAKSYSFADAAILRVFNDEFRNVLCLRQFQRSIRTSVYQLLLDRIEYMDLKWRGRPFYSATNEEIRGVNGSRFRFHQLQTNLNSIRSMPNVDLAWITEARDVSEESIRVVRPTIFRNEGAEFWADWNPELPEDPIDAMFRGTAGPPPGSVVVEMNHSDNPYFGGSMREEMEWDFARDPVTAEHTWNGAYLQRTDAQVFKNWRVEDCAPPESARILMGGDFGFGETDPTCGVGCWIDGKTLYIDREAWALRLSLDHLPALLAGSDTNDPPRWENPDNRPGVPGAMEWPWRMDSSRPDLINFLAARGFSVQGATKGAGSIKAGVDWLQSFDIVIHPRCVRTIAEFKAYQYKVDKKTGEILPQLVDANNHIIDALRYAVELYRRGNVIF
jgi:phage terminase large subunit